LRLGDGAGFQGKALFNLGKQTLGSGAGIGANHEAVIA
jgi:hypothetical protein